MQEMIKVYLTGAASDGGAQANPDASLGHYRSSSEFVAVGFEYTDGGMTGLLVEFVSGACLEAATPTANTATITAGEANSLTFRGPGGAAGDAAVLADDGEAVIQDGLYPGMLARVSRDGDTELRGAATLRVVERVNNLFSDLPSGWVCDALTDYRCVCLKNTTDFPITNLKIWLGGDGDTTLAIAYEAPSAQPDGYFTTIALPSDDPGLTFVQPDSATHADVLTAALLYPGQIAGLWIRRAASVGDTPGGRKQLDIQLQYDSYVL